MNIQEFPAAKMTSWNIIQWTSGRVWHYGSPRDQLEKVGNEALIAAGVTRVIFECPKRVGDWESCCFLWFHDAQFGEPSDPPSFSLFLV